MKNALIALLALFVASAAFGQSGTGIPLKADSVVIYKTGGNSLLTIKNATKDSLHGLLTNVGAGTTQFLKSRMLNDSTLLIGGDTLHFSGGSGGGGGGEDLQQTLIIGNTTTQKIVWDSVHTRPGHNQSFDYTIFEINPLDTADTNEAFRFGVSVTGGTASLLEPLHSNNVAYFGWNVTNQGAVNRLGTPMIAMGMEQRWRPDSTIDNTEWHQVYGDLAGRLYRISSYTIDNLSNNIQYFQTIDNYSIKRSLDDSVWFGMTLGGFQYERFGDHASWGMSGDASGVQLSHTGGSAIGDVLTMSGFGSAFLPFSVTLSDIDNHHSGSAIVMTDSIGTLMTISTDRTSGGTEFTTETASGLGMNFNPNNVTTVAIHPDYTAFVKPVIYDDNPLVGAPSQRVYIKTNGSYAVAERIDNNSAGSNTYNLQLVSTGTATQNELLYLLGINNGGASGNILIHTTTNTLVGASNWVVYSESPAQSTWAGWHRFGDVALSNPQESGDFAGKVKIDSLDADGGGNAITTWDNTTHRIEKRLSPEGSSTLDFGSTSGGASTDLTITVTGAVSGDIVWLGVPNGSMPAGGTFFAWVSAADTVTVRFANNSGGSLDPSSGTFKVKVLK